MNLLLLLIISNNNNNNWTNFIIQQFKGTWISYYYTTSYYYFFFFLSFFFLLLVCCCVCATVLFFLLHQRIYYPSVSTKFRRNKSNRFDLQLFRNNVKFTARQGKLPTVVRNWYCIVELILFFACQRNIGLSLSF